MTIWTEPSKSTTDSGSNLHCWLSIVIPVYKSATILPDLVAQISQVLDGYAAGRAFEIVLVNDGSPDSSWLAITACAGRYAFVKGICLTKNVGQHNATMAGLKASRGEIVIIMDDDLQHPPSALPELVKAIEDDFDICYTRYADRQHAAWKKIGSSFNNLVASYLLAKPRDLYLSSFKAIHRRIVNEIVRYDGPYVYIDGLLLDVTRHIKVITVEHRKRNDGDGNYNLRRSVSLWLKMATSFSVLPLRLATIVGGVVAALSMVVLLGVIVQKLVHPQTEAGWTSLMVVTLLFSGIQLLFLGVIGEYIGRAYLKLNGKSQYVVREIIQMNQDNLAAGSSDARTEAQRNES